MSERAPLSMTQQAELVDALLARCVTLDGNTADETTLTITRQDADDLRHLVIRLRRMSSHEAGIRKMVMGK